MKAICFVLVVFLMCSSCYSYKKTVINRDALVTGKHYKLTFKNGVAKRIKFNAEKDSLKMASLFFGNSKKMAITDATEIKEGKFSFLKTSLVSVVAAFFIRLLYAFYDFPLDAGGNFQL